MRVRFTRYIALGDMSYKPGDVAEVDRGAELIGSGKAEPAGAPISIAHDTGPDYLSMPYRDLQTAAKLRGIPANQSKDALIEALTA